jgi:hypothetical protein
LNPLTAPLCKHNIKTENARSVPDVDRVCKITIQHTVYKFYITDVQFVFQIKMQDMTDLQGKKSSMKLKKLFHIKDEFKGILIEKIISGKRICYEQ